jgi:hypothetical protein
MFSQSNPWIAKELSDDRIRQAERHRLARRAAEVRRRVRRAKEA